MDFQKEIDELDLLIAKHLKQINEWQSSIQELTNETLRIQGAKRFLELKMSEEHKE
jgi:hypothetical protein